MHRSAYAAGFQVSLYACSHRLLALLGVGFLFVLLSNCTTVPEREGVSVPSETSANIIKTLQGREANVASLKGLFQAEVTGNGMVFAQSFQGSILYQRPDQYRIKGFTRFGGMVFDFVLSGRFYALRVKDQPRPIVGGLDNFHRLGDLRLPVLLSLRAVEVLLGKLPLNAENPIIMDVSENMYKFETPPDSSSNNSQLSQRILIDQQSLHVRQLSYVDTEGEPVVSIRTSDFRPVQNGSPVQSQTIQLPFHVQAEDHREAGSIELEFLEIVTNEAIDEQLFTLTAF